MVKSRSYRGLQHLARFLYLTSTLSLFIRLWEAWQLFKHPAKPEFLEYEGTYLGKLRDAAIYLALIVICISWDRRMIRLTRQLRPGYCRKCGYDLRATPDRCPECGTIPAEQRK
jgi:predicted Zn-ribbon and HTH transcriptional regulator